MELVERQDTCKQRIVDTRATGAGITSPVSTERCSSGRGNIGTPKSSEEHHEKGWSMCED
jgi:hypothetical protein